MKQRHHAIAAGPYSTVTATGTPAGSGLKSFAPTAWLARLFTNGEVGPTIGLRFSGLALLPLPKPTWYMWTGTLLGPGSRLDCSFAGELD